MADKVKDKKKKKGGADGKKREAERPPAPKGPARLETDYRGRVVPALVKKRGYQNPMRVPRLKHIVVNSGVGEAVANAGALEYVAGEITIITGQKPVITRARKDISGFKIRAGVPIGCKVTLRKRRMYEFYDRLVNIAIPRIRDFRGVSPAAFDGRGNYSLGLKEQVIFPEIDYDKIQRVYSLQVCIATSARTDDEARDLLALMGMPFREK